MLTDYGYLRHDCTAFCTKRKAVKRFGRYPTHIYLDNNSGMSEQAEGHTK